MATYYVSNPGNIAIQNECWLLSQAEAKAYLDAYRPGKGTYFYGIAQGYRRARRNKSDSIPFTTGGFATGEFSNQLCALDITITERATYKAVDDDDHLDRADAYYSRLLGF